MKSSTLRNRHTELNDNQVSSKNYIRKQQDESRIEAELATKTSSYLIAGDKPAKSISTVKKTGRRSPGDLSKKNVAKKAAQPSVIEAFKGDDFLNLASKKGLQIHPKQQHDLEREERLRDILMQSHNDDPQTKKVLQRASAIQASIQSSAQMYEECHHIMDTKAKLNQSVNKILQSFEFEKGLKQSIAEQIAHDIAENIKSSYQNQNEDEGLSRSDLNKDEDDLQLSKSTESKFKKLTRKQKLAHLTQGTFSSNQKATVSDITNSEYGMPSERQQFLSKSQADKIKGKKIKASVSPKKKNQKKSFIDLQPEEPKIISQQKKTKSLSTVRSGPVQLKKMKQSQITSHVRLQDKLNESALELTQKMKLININDLQHLTANQSFTLGMMPARRKSEEDLRKASPGVAPTVNPQANMWTFQQQSSGKMTSGVVLGRHIKNENSIIPEATEEHLHYPSNELKLDADPNARNHRTSRLDRQKKSILQSATINTAISPKSSLNGQKEPFSNYFKQLGKRYLDRSKSTSQTRFKDVSQQQSSARQEKNQQESPNFNQTGKFNFNTIDNSTSKKNSIKSKKQVEEASTFSLSKVSNKQKTECFSRKNSSPSPFRLKGLQQKYFKEKEKERASQNFSKSEEIQAYVAMKSQYKNQYLQALEEAEDEKEDVQLLITNDVQSQEEQCYENQNKTFDTQDDLKVQKEPSRRSRKERSRDNLQKFRPLSHNLVEAPHVTNVVVLSREQLPNHTNSFDLIQRDSKDQSSRNEDNALQRLINERLSNFEPFSQHKDRPLASTSMPSSDRARSQRNAESNSKIGTRAAHQKLQQSPVKSAKKSKNKQMKQIFGMFEPKNSVVENVKNSKSASKYSSKQTYSRAIKTSGSKLLASPLKTMAGLVSNSKNSSNDKKQTL